MNKVILIISKNNYNFLSSRVSTLIIKGFKAV